MDRLFRLATTSFIYPDHIIPNVKKIGAFFDEIELLVFESQPADVLPSPLDIAELAALSQDLNVTYNVHLPVDISLTHGSGRERRKAADTIARVVELFEPAAPTTHTLHLEMDGVNHFSPANPVSWQENALDGLNLLIPHLPGPKTLSVETLDYPPRFLAPILASYDVDVCIDAGHHFKYGFDLEHSFNTFSGRIAVVHLHGVSAKGPEILDHLSLDRLDPDRFNLVVGLLRAYTGTVCLEVFGLEKLNRSLEKLADCFPDIPGRLTP